MIRTTLAAAAIAMVAIVAPAAAGERPAATLYKNPQCNCCEEYAKYLRQNGYEVKIEATHDLPLIRKQVGVPEKLAGCHTMVIDKYVVEGHVPVNTLNKLLEEHPDIKGISLPGMLEGTPGMTGRKAGPFTIYEIGSKAASKVYAVE